MVSSINNSLGIDYLLSNDIIKKAKPTNKIYKLRDGNCLYLQVEPNGKKYWRFQYRFAGKQKMISMGVFPKTSAEEARKKRDEAQMLLSQDIDPSEERNQTKAHISTTHSNTFKKIAVEWHNKRKLALKPSHAITIIRRLEADIFPVLGQRPISKITASELLTSLQKVEKRGAIEVAHRILQICGQVFRYGIATGRCERDVSADLKGALKPAVKKHYNYLQEKDLPEFLNKLEDYKKQGGDLQTQLAVKLLAYTFVRTTELREAAWDEINLDMAEWRIPAARMKMKRDHIVPLSRQAIAILRGISLLHQHKQLIFPSHVNPDNSISNNTMLYALYRMGYHRRATGHGFRATASTILNEMGFRSDLIELQLAHVEKNGVRAAYNHSQLLPERSRMMQIWANYLDQAKEGVTLAEFKKSLFPETAVTNGQLFASHG